MKEITVGELAQYSPWVERLETFSRGPRTETDVFREYDAEKYASLLEVKTMSEALRIPQGNTCFSRHGKLYVSSGEEAQAQYEKLFLDSIDFSRAETIIELGGGYGYHSHLLQKKYPDKKHIVGEFSPNARMLGARITSGIQFVPFNFYSDWSVFDTLKQAAVFTVHAVEMLEDVGFFLNKLKNYEQKIISTVLYEPLYIAGNDHLSQLRRKYIEVNRYNQNLPSLLPEAEIEDDFFGFNPLFPVARIPII